MIVLCGEALDLSAGEIQLRLGPLDNRRQPQIVAAMRKIERRHGLLDDLCRDIETLRGKGRPDVSPWNGVVIANVGHKLRQSVSVPGKFRWPELWRDAFRPILSGLTGLVYVKSMTYGGHDLRHELLRVGEAFEGAEMKIVLGADGGKISITAVDDQGGPLPDMTVLVSPEGATPAAITDELVEGVTDKAGLFVTGALAPGRYRVLVRTESADRSPESLPSLAQAIASGEAVELAPKSLRDVR